MRQFHEEFLSSMTIRVSFQHLNTNSHRHAHSSREHCEFWTRTGLSNPNIVSFILYFRANRAGIQRFMGLSICENVERQSGVMELKYPHLLEMMPRGHCPIDGKLFWVCS